jgi:hypothetical protein
LFKTPFRFLALALTLGTPAFAALAADNDSLTGIPVYPSAVGNGERIPGGICRATAQTVVYLVPFLWGPNNTAAPKQIQIADVEQWYQAHLKDFRFIPGFDGQRTQDVFLSADGTKAVTVTGKPAHSPVAYAISYTRFSSPVQPNQVKSFASAQKTQC